MPSLAMPFPVPCPERSAHDPGLHWAQAGYAAPAHVFPAPSVVAAEPGLLRAPPRSWEVREVPVYAQVQPARGCAPSVVRSRSLPQPRTLLKFEVLPYAQSRSRLASSGEVSSQLSSRTANLVHEASWQPWEEFRDDRESNSLAQEAKVASYGPVLTPRPLIEDGTLSSTRSTLLVPRYDSRTGVEEVTSPGCEISSGSEASTVAVPHFPRPVLSGSSRATQTEADVEDVSAALGGSRMDSLHQLVAKRAMDVEENDRPPSEPSIEDDVKVAEMILRPVSESLERLRVSIEASTPRLEAEPSPSALSARSASPSPIFHPANSWEAEVQTAAPGGVSVREEVISEALQSSHRSADIEVSKAPVLAEVCLEVLSQLESELSNLEAIVAAVEGAKQLVGRTSPKRERAA
ncbi:unnamed protein product [Effrenium voratum]|nr:unnamed protein product [Effrenium voratum]